MTDTITIIMLSARVVEGKPQPKGARIKVPAPLAHELSASGWAACADPDDVARARMAFVNEQKSMLKALNGSRPFTAGSPWQAWR